MWEIVPNSGRHEISGILTNIHKLRHKYASFTTVKKKESPSMGYKRGSGLKRPTLLVGVLEKCILTQSDYSIIWGMFSGGDFTMCSKYALKRTYPLTHIRSWGFSWRKTPQTCTKLYLQWWSLQCFNSKVLATTLCPTTGDWINTLWWRTEHQNVESSKCGKKYWLT